MQEVYTIIYNNIPPKRFTQPIKVTSSEASIRFAPQPYKQDYPISTMAKKTEMAAIEQKRWWSPSASRLPGLIASWQLLYPTIMAMTENTAIIRPRRHPLIAASNSKIANSHTRLSLFCQQFLDSCADGFPSAFPANCLVAAPITLPRSASDVAPTSANQPGKESPSVLLHPFAWAETSRSRLIFLFLLRKVSPVLLLKYLSGVFALLHHLLKQFYLVFLFQFLLRRLPTFLPGEWPL